MVDKIKLDGKNEVLVNALKLFFQSVGIGALIVNGIISLVISFIYMGANLFSLTNWVISILIFLGIGVIIYVVFLLITIFTTIWSNFDKIQANINRRR